MASTASYARPKARPTPAAHPALAANGRTALTVLLVTAALIGLAFLQVYLASQATDAINSLKRLERTTSLLQGEVDAYQAEIEYLMSPGRIEVEAIRLGLQPITNVEFLR